jgi:hypothetical protein
MSDLLETTLPKSKVNFSDERVCRFNELRALQDTLLLTRHLEYKTDLSVASQVSGDCDTIH